jgi:hypothetical protein
MEDFQERRRSQRFAFPFEILYKDSNKAAQGFKHAYGKNISEHGALFETYEIFPSLTILELKIEIPMPESENEKKSFNILAEVVRVDEVKRQWLYNIGVSFCKIEEDCLSSIAEYISNSFYKESKHINCLAEI